MIQAERATFEQVKQAQQKLIFYYMLKLEKKNCFINPKNRESFWDAFDTATIGEASKHRYMYNHPDIVCDLGSVSDFCKKMIFFKPSEDGKTIIRMHGMDYNVSMWFLWKTLRECLIPPMDAALSKAHGASAELLTHPRDGFEVGEKTDRKKTKNDLA